MVHARDGRLLLLTGGVGAASFCWVGVSFFELGLELLFSGEEGRSFGIGGGEGSRDMFLGEIRWVYRSYGVLHVEDHGFALGNR